MRGGMRRIRDGLTSTYQQHQPQELNTGGTQEHRVERCSGWSWDWAIRYGLTHYLSSWSPKLNRSVRSPIAGLFNGTYGLLWLVTGLGKLSRLRAVSGASPQLDSMNFRIEAWSV